MAANLLSFPFRLNAIGSVAALADDSEEYYGEELAVLVSTVPGERKLVPTYGMTDPTFDQFDPAELELKVSLFGPPVRISNVVAAWTGAGQQDVIIEYDPAR